MNAEAELLSAVLRNNDIALVLQSAVDELFVTHVDIWEHIRNHYVKYKTVPSPVDVELQFLDFHLIETRHPTKYYLDEFVAAYVDNEMRTLVKQAATDINAGKSPKALQDLSASVARLARTSVAVTDIDLSDVESAVAYFIRKQQQDTSGIKTGWDGFDVCMPSGMNAGMLTVLLAFPQIGKSWIALHMAVQAWKQGYTPMIVSLEMSEHEVRNRLYAIIGNGKWSHRRLVAGLVDVDEFKTWATETFTNKPSFHIISTDGLGAVTPDVIRGKIDQYKPDFVVVDYLQLMESNKHSDNEVVRVKTISRDMKLLALSEKLPVVLIASATPDENTEMQTPPELGQVAWSKQIAYDADVVLAMGREPTSPELEVVFRKNRHGPLGDFALQMSFDTGQFIYIDLDTVV